MEYDLCINLYCYSAFVSMKKSATSRATKLISGQCGIFLFEDERWKELQSADQRTSTQSQTVKQGFETEQHPACPGSEPFVSSASSRTLPAIMSLQVNKGLFRCKTSIFADVKSDAHQQ